MMSQLFCLKQHRFSNVLLSLTALLSLLLSKMKYGATIKSISIFFFNRPTAELFCTTGYIVNPVGGDR